MLLLQKGRDAVPPHAPHRQPVALAMLELPQRLALLRQRRERQHVERRAGRGQLAGRGRELGGLLVAAGLHDTAEDYLRRLVATFPGTFTWHYRYAGFLRDHRSAAEALPEAEAALKASGGEREAVLSSQVSESSARVLALEKQVEELIESNRSKIRLNNNPDDEDFTTKVFTRSTMFLTLGSC